MYYLRPTIFTTFSVSGPSSRIFDHSESMRSCISFSISSPFLLIISSFYWIFIWISRFLSSNWRMLILVRNLRLAYEYLEQRMMFSFLFEMFMYLLLRWFILLMALLDDIFGYSLTISIFSSSDSCWGLMHPLLI